MDGWIFKIRLDLKRNFFKLVLFYNPRGPQTRCEISAGPKKKSLINLNAHPRQQQHTLPMVQQWSTVDVIISRIRPGSGWAGKDQYVFLLTRARPDPSIGSKILARAHSTLGPTARELKYSYLNSERAPLAAGPPRSHGGRAA